MSHRVKIGIYASMTVGCMLLIFLMSAKDGGASMRLSDGMAQTFIGRVLSRMPSITGEGIGSDIRKYGHVAEFFLLGITSALFFGEIIVSESVGLMRSFLAALISALFCFAYACSDEFHQTFIAGRCGRFSDVGFDSAGYLAGILLILLFSIYKNRKPKSE